MLLPSHTHWHLQRFPRGPGPGVVFRLVHTPTPSLPQTLLRFSGPEAVFLSDEILPRAVSLRRESLSLLPVSRPGDGTGLQPRDSCPLRVPFPPTSTWSEGYVFVPSSLLNVQNVSRAGTGRGFPRLQPRPSRRPPARSHEEELLLRPRAASTPLETRKTP